jgi:hypothetical protein
MTDDDGAAGGAEPHRFEAEDLDELAAILSKAAGIDLSRGQPGRVDLDRWLRNWARWHLDFPTDLEVSRRYKKLRRDRVLLRLADAKDGPTRALADPDIPWLLTRQHLPGPTWRKFVRDSLIFEEWTTLGDRAEKLPLIRHDELRAIAADPSRHDELRPHLRKLHEHLKLAYPHGSENVDRNEAVQSLADIYERVSGQTPAAGVDRAGCPGGPFFRFVSEVFSLFGFFADQTPDAIGNAIKSALRERRRTAARSEWEASREIAQRAPEPIPGAPPGGGVFVPVRDPTDDDG